MTRTRRLVAAGLLVAVAGAAAWTAVAASRGLPAQVVRVAGAGSAVAAAARGSDLWLLNSPSGRPASVVELKASNGKAIRALPGRRYGLDHPVAIAAGGPSVWIASNPQQGSGQLPKPGDGTLTEINADNGRWIRSLSGSDYGFDYPGALTIENGSVWVANSWGGPGDQGKITEIDGSSGKLIRTMAGPGYSLHQPSAITVAAGSVWIASRAGGANDGGTVTEIRASDGHLIRTLAQSRYHFNGPSALAVYGADLWVANGYPAGDGGSVTEIDLRSGRWIRTLHDSRCGFDSPSSIAVQGPFLWISSSNLNGTGGSVTEVDARRGICLRHLSSGNWLSELLDGTWIRIIAGKGYGLSNPADIAVTGRRIWVVNGNGTFTVLDGS